MLIAIFELYNGDEFEIGPNIKIRTEIYSAVLDNCEGNFGSCFVD
jgi:hypothetical protein